MPLRLLASAIIALLIATSASLAFQASTPDVTGEWSGTVFTLNANPPTGVEPIYLDLKQTGKKVSGSCGPSAIRRMMTIARGSAETTASGTTVSLDVDMQNAPLLQFELKLEGTVLKGTVKNLSTGTTKTVELERSK